MIGCIGRVFLWTSSFTKLLIGVFHSLFHIYQHLPPTWCISVGKHTRYLEHIRDILRLEGKSTRFFPFWGVKILLSGFSRKDQPVSLESCVQKRVHSQTIAPGKHDQFHRSMAVPCLQAAKSRTSLNYPAWWMFTVCEPEKGPVKIVDLSIKMCDFPVRKLLVYQAGQ